MAYPIFVTGATGTVGASLVRQLNKMGMFVIAGARTKPKFDFFNSKVTDYCQIDLADKYSIKEALTNIKSTFLLPPPSQNMVQLCGNFFEVAASSHINHLVLLSSFGAGAAQPTTLARMHLKIEDTLKSTGIPYTILRPNSFMQNLLKYKSQIIDSGIIHSHIGDSSISFIDAADIARVAASVLIYQKPIGSVFPLTGPSAHSFPQIALIISNSLSRPIDCVQMSPEDTKVQMLDSGTPPWLTQILLDIYQHQRKGFASPVTEFVQAITGQEPISLTEFISNQFDRERT